MQRGRGHSVEGIRGVDDGIQDHPVIATAWFRVIVVVRLHPQDLRGVPIARVEVHVGSVHGQAGVGDATVAPRHLVQGSGGLCWC